jgi:hypothetical protein
MVMSGTDPTMYRPLGDARKILGAVGHRAARQVTPTTMTLPIAPPISTMQNQLGT